MMKQTSPLEQWQQLVDILDRIDKRGLKSLSTAELLDFGKLYRRSVSALAYARAHGLNPEHTHFLNQLVGRAYGHVYTAESKGLASWLHFFTYTFPYRIRTEWPFLAAATGIITFVALFSYVLVMLNPSLAWQILPEGFEFLSEYVVNRHEEGGDWLPLTIRPSSVVEILTNNIGVAFYAFAGGIFLGLGTLYILYVNGTMLGTIIAAFAQADAVASINFWGFVAPHGVIELPAIFIAAATGLMLGYALINPGDYDRKTSLKLTARKAVDIVIGVVIMLVIAGFIEGFFSPTLLAEWIKFTFAAVVFAALLWYLFWMPLKRKI